MVAIDRPISSRRCLRHLARYLRPQQLSVKILIVEGTSLSFSEYFIYEITGFAKKGKVEVVMARSEMLT